MRTKPLLFLAVAVCFSSWASASAAETRIIQNKAPVSLTTCEAFTEKVVVTWRGKVVPFGKLSPFDVDDRNKTETAMHLGTAFINNSDSRATAVRVSFVGFDSFGTRAASGTTTYTGEFGPGVLIERTKTGAFEPFESEWQGNIATVNCSIDAVALSNGTTWRPETVGSSAPNTLIDGDTANNAPSNPLFIPKLEAPYVLDDAHLLSAGTKSSLILRNNDLLSRHKPVLAVYTLQSTKGADLQSIARHVVDDAKLEGILIIVSVDPKLLGVVTSQSVESRTCDKDAMRTARLMVGKAFTLGHYDSGITQASDFLVSTCIP